MGAWNKALSDSTDLTSNLPFDSQDEMVNNSAGRGI